MTVFVLMGWGGRCEGVAASEEIARARGYVRYSENGSFTQGYFDEWEVSTMVPVAAQ